MSLEIDRLDEVIFDQMVLLTIMAIFTGSQQNLGFQED